VKSLAFGSLGLFWIVNVKTGILLTIISIVSPSDFVVESKFNYQ